MGAPPWINWTTPPFFEVHLKVFKYFGKVMVNLEIFFEFFKQSIGFLECVTTENVVN